MTAASLRVENIQKAFGDKSVLNGISFSAKPGEFIVLVGPSGCGKSTMLRAIAGLEGIDDGSIFISDRDVSGLQPKDRNIAMVFQDYALYPHKSVYENIAFGLRIRKMPAEEIDQRVQFAADKLGLSGLLQRRPAQLSGGQRQRVAIGRAIVRKPDVFLFDEPLSNLDAKLRGSMRVSIAKLHKDLHATVVYVTHDQVEAMTLATRIIVLHQGRIQQMGPPLELYHYPTNKFVAQFIGSPPMNMIDGHIDRSSDRLIFVTDKGVRIPLPQKFSSKLAQKHGSDTPVSWGIRPEGFRLAEDTDKNEDTLEAVVEVVEPLGALNSVIVDLGGHEIQIMLPEHCRPSPEQTIRLALRGSDLHLFDNKTGERLPENP